MPSPTLTRISMSGSTDGWRPSTTACACRQCYCCSILQRRLAAPAASTTFLSLLPLPPPSALDRGGLSHTMHSIEGQREGRNERSRPSVGGEPPVRARLAKTPGAVLTLEPDRGLR